MALDIDDSVIDIAAVEQDIIVQQKRLARQKGEKNIIDMNVAPKKSGMTMLDTLKIYHAIIVNNDELYKKLRYRQHDPMKVMIAILEKSIEKDDYVKATLEWRSLTPRVSKTNHCECNHGVGWDYPIKNRLNGNVVTLGSDCIMNYVGFDQKVAGKFAKTFHTQLNPDHLQKIDDRHKAWAATLNKAKEREKFRLFLEKHNLTMAEVVQMLTEFMKDYDKYGCFMGNYLQLYKEGLDYITKEAYMTNTQFEQWQAYEGMDKNFARKEWDKELEAFKELTVYRRSRSYDEIYNARTGETGIRHIPKLDNDVKLMRFILDHIQYDCYFKGQHPEFSYRAPYFGYGRVNIYMNVQDADVCNDYFAMLEYYQKRGDFVDIFKQYSSSYGVRKQTQSRLECRWLKHEGKPQKDWLLSAKIERPKLDENDQPITDDKGKVQVEKTTMANLYKNEIMVKPTEVLELVKKLRPKAGFPLSTENAAKGEWMTKFIDQLGKKNVSYYNSYVDLSGGKISYLFSGIRKEPQYVLGIDILPHDGTVKFQLRDVKSQDNVAFHKAYLRYEPGDMFDHVQRVDFDAISHYTPPATVPPKTTGPVSTPKPRPQPATPVPAPGPAAVAQTPINASAATKTKLEDIANHIWGDAFMKTHSLQLVKVRGNTGIFEFTGTGRVPSKDWRGALDKLKNLKKDAYVKKNYPKAVGRAAQSRECSGGKSFSWCWVIQLEGRERV